uniref:Penaeidin 3-1 n=1 Tax=Penaeus chinensis TaxID=139456 RepID=Q7Z286_PENCE|nr:penaeidin 3-1 [Penaeus chinensis]
MRLVVCLVFLASFALVCQGQKGGYTRPISRPPYGGGYGNVCTSCHVLTTSQARSCCSRFGRCCVPRRGYSG